MRKTKLRTSGTNLSRTKAHNLRVVIEVIRTQAPISKTEIATITSLSRQTIQYIVAELEAAELVELIDGEIKGRGHPGKKIVLAPTGAFNIGIHVDKLSIRAVVCDLVGDVVWQQSQRLKNWNIDDANRLIKSVFDKFVAEHPSKAKKLVGVGVAAPGPFNETNIRPDDLANFQQVGTSKNIKKLSAEIGLPFIVENDATAGAIGEHLHGEGKPFDTFVFLQFGIGLGAGLILNGNKFAGSSEIAGEVGHIVVEPDGLNCSCGKSGCLERYLSIDALCRDLNLQIDDETLNEKITELIAQRNQALLDWIDEATPRFRQLVNTLEMIVDPEIIIVGGTVPKPFLDLLISRSKPFLKPLNRQRGGEQVRVGTAGDFVVAAGAAAASAESHFAPALTSLIL
ncbi:ROK family transcriptional regulator [Maritalea sp.]|uniref:ROK family transcriptional regulator n=1 Tax=Maritalea sp. TaxID=2003361 RepID=UPI003EF8A821